MEVNSDMLHCTRLQRPHRRIDTVGRNAEQVALGIATLLLAVPVVLGAAHQAVAMLLFTVALYLVHALRRY